MSDSHLDAELTMTDKKPDDVVKQASDEALSDLPAMPDDAAEKVKGGWSPRAPAPGAPQGVPIPYPNLPK